MRFWSQTHTGRAFDLENPKPEMFDITDIATSLARTNRFNGQTYSYPYSVAQHCILAVKYAHGSDYIKQWALMHEMAEPYIGDIVSPVKRMIPEIKKCEDVILKAGAERFGLNWPPPPIIKLIDNRLLMTEKRDLMREEPRPWGYKNVKPYAEQIFPYADPTFAFKAFLLLFDVLFPAFRCRY